MRRSRLVLALAGVLVGLLIGVPALYSQTVSAVFIDITNQALASSAAIITTSRPLINLVQTWNASGVTFGAIQLDVTDTASAAGSKLLDLEVGNADVFTVNKSGDVVAAGTITSTGAISGAAQTRVVFYPAIEYCRSDKPSAELVPLRVAKGDWGLSRTAGGAETYNIRCTLTPPKGWSTTASKGARLDSFRVAHQITVVDLTSNTFGDLSTVTYVNNTANAVADYGGVVTVTLPTVVQANPYLTAATLATAAFMTTINADVNLDWTAVMANTGVYTLYGVSATWTLQD